MLNFSYTNLYLQFRAVRYFLCISWPSPRPLCYFLYPHLLLYCFSCRLHYCFLCNFFSLIPLFLCHFFLEYFNLLSKFRFLLSFYCFLLMIFMTHSTGGRPTSMPSTMDYTTLGDPNQVTPPVYINTAQATAQNQFFPSNNFFIPDGRNRHIHEIRDKVFHTGYLENGNTAYLLELPGLKDMLHTNKFLMDEMSGQFYAVYGNTYQQMSTKPMLEQSWGTGELVDQLAVTRQTFGYTGPSGPTPPLNQPQPAASTTCNPQDNFLSKKPAPTNVQY